MLINKFSLLELLVQSISLLVQSNIVIFYFIWIPQVLVAALKFFLGSDGEEKGENDSDSDSDVEVACFSFVA